MAQQTKTATFEGQSHSSWRDSAYQAISDIRDAIAGIEFGSTATVSLTLTYDDGVVEEVKETKKSKKDAE